MCLANITDKPVINDMEVVAYKVFIDVEDRPEFEFMPHRGSYQVPVSTWLRAEPSEMVLHARNGIKYPCGFHAFKHLEDAMIWKREGQVVYKVKIRGLHTVGYHKYSQAMGQTGRLPEVLVSNEMYVGGPIE